MAAADLLDMITDTPLQGPVTDVRDFVYLLAMALKDSLSRIWA